MFFKVLIYSTSLYKTVMNCAPAPPNGGVKVPNKHLTANP